MPVPNDDFRSVALKTRQNAEEDAGQVRRGLKLYEISNQIQLAQTEAQANVATKLGLPHPYQQDYHTMAVQLDECLHRWESGLSSDWKLRNIPKVIDKASQAELYLLHVR